MLALSTQWLMTAFPPSSPSPAPLPTGSAVASAATSSASPSPSPTPAAPILLGYMPKSIGGTTMSTDSATDATTLGNSPNSRALNAAVVAMGKKASDLEVADAYDASGTLTVSVLGFRVAGIEPSKLETAVLDAWLAGNTKGVKTTSVKLGTTTATEVTYGDTGPAEYLLIFKDAVIVIQSTDITTAKSALAAMTNPEATASPSASPSAAPTPSPSAS